MSLLFSASNCRRSTNATIRMASAERCNGLLPRNYMYRFRFCLSYSDVFFCRTFHSLFWTALVLPTLDLALQGEDAASDRLRQALRLFVEFIIRLTTQYASVEERTTAGAACRELWQPMMDGMVDVFGVTYSQALTHDLWHAADTLAKNGNLANYSGHFFEWNFQGLAKHIHGHSSMAAQAAANLTILQAGLPYARVLLREKHWFSGKPMFGAVFRNADEVRELLCDRLPQCGEHSLIRLSHCLRVAGEDGRFRARWRTRRRRPTKACPTATPSFDDSIVCYLDPFMDTPRYGEILAIADIREPASPTTSIKFVIRPFVLEAAPPYGIHIPTYAVSSVVCRQSGVHVVGLSSLKRHCVAIRFNGEVRFVSDLTITYMYRQ